MFALILLLPLLYMSATYNYLFFHTLVEMFCVVVAAGVFMFAWNGRKLSGNSYFLFIGMTYLSVGIIDFLHTLAYKGMSIFPGFDANLPTQLWIASRYFLAVSLMVAPFFIRRKLNEAAALVVYSAVMLLIVLFTFEWKMFPDSYIEGVGLTQFKVVSEYVISGLFAAAMVLLYRHREHFDRKVFTYLLISFGLNIVSELLFTLYVGVYDLPNRIGHIVKLISYYLVYKAIIEVGLSQPYNLLFLELKRLEQQKDELMHIASHELKNPISSIKAYSSLLKRRLTTSHGEKEISMVEVINEQTDRVIRLVNEMMDVSQLDGHENSVVFATFDFDSFVNQVVDSQIRIHKNHRIVVKGKTGVSVHGDKDKLTQVMVNFITNAVKYSPEKSTVTVAVSINENFVTLSVTDKGIGIPKDKLNHVFDKYYRTDSAKQANKGLGLGLYISKSIIDSHQGKIWATSDVGKGSTFSFSLPVTT